ncbi:SUMO-targeted ubiquitin-protein ligase E3 Slx8 [Schizosaccharomyces cryophilus OY26]|uniref:SUMO-targeted ubiquitin-protein ligase E3 Slx8 n=1 Tax=Schizosaccharomyces cryophilus (strain OY26 / ATCC MYA-4695 / CBS 11777 / NBRC 106824 / NRRL Y48691) TaxID=653667 RepID=S9VT24_SCHCR|nr:SUMO-targeted ubiquitin-protein ligase E3 Slx8 [Schizosaccharomyces cryophilus OY26]EPY49304.1 SUMO-targeted ubiquitin-protein ligase E3 Slx8 [Schizosaccharomyces cryophilus OY26]
MPPTPRSGSQRYVPYDVRIPRSPREAAAVAAARRQNRRSSEVSYSTEEAPHESPSEHGDIRGVADRDVDEVFNNHGLQQNTYPGLSEASSVPRSVRSLAHNESLGSLERSRNEWSAELDNLDDLDVLEDISPLQEVSQCRDPSGNSMSAYDDVIDLTEAEQKLSQPKQRNRKQKPSSEAAPGIASVNNSQRLADYKCVICLDNPENLSATPCGHIFCNFCILSALGNSSATQKCPVCRRKVHPKNVICLEMMLGSEQNNKD